MSEISDFSGRDLGRYRLLQRIGAGGMGEVYDAVDETLGRHVAVKILPPDVASDPMRVRRFAQEARTASSLNHPHLVSIFDIGTQTVGGRELQFIAMEKIDGQTLRDTLAAGRMPLARGVELMAQIADALAAAHAAGIVHRDLKPENIMVTTSGYPKVLDFGLARAVTTKPASDATTQTGVILGTAGYMAPEQAEGLAADARSDIFSLGCILYEVATGKRAFRGKSAIDTLHEIVHSDPPSMPNAPPELQRITRKALAKNPNDRYQSARDLAIDLHELARTLHTPRRNTMTIVAATLAVIAIAVTIALLMRRHSAAAPVPNLRRLTVTGDVINATISPDGKYLCFVTSRADGMSLFIRQLASGQDLQIVPPMPATGVFGITFAPDGSAVLYVLKSRRDGGGGLYRISTLGGRPERLLSGLDSPVAFAPDGARFAYVRAEFPRPGQTALMVANSNGSGAHAVAVRNYPEVFTPIFFTGPSWSPDGKLIAAAVRRAAKPAESRLFAFGADGGEEHPISDKSWHAASQTAWLPDQSGLLLVASDDFIDFTHTQMWLVPWPTGAPRAVTNDLFAYRGVSLSADGKSLVTVTFDGTTQGWLVPLGSPWSARNITSGRNDCGAGLAVASDGRIVFSAYTGAGTTLQIAAADGTNVQRLTRDNVDSRVPSAYRGGIAYVCTDRSSSDVCTIGLDGEGKRTVIRGIDPAPIAASPDGSRIAYALNRRLWCVNSDGSHARQLSSDLVVDQTFSPTGDRIAMIAERGGQQFLSVIDAQSGTLLWNAPATVHVNGSCVRWMHDGSALLVNDHGQDKMNVWKVPFTGAPEKLTNFNDLTASWFDLTADGKSIVMGRAQFRRDAVLMTNFR